MKDKLKGLIAGLLIGVMVSSAVAYAAAGTSIDVYFKSLKYYFDGEEKIPAANAKGFIYQGTTYVPLRFISEALGKPAKYDGASNTIRVGEWYKQEPAMTIDKKKTYQAVVETTKGSFTIEFFAKDAPKTTNVIVSLAKDGYFNDITFHRVVKSFMIQTGDPTGTGMGGTGFSFEDELDNGHQYADGTVAMANAGPDTNGSQIFICSGSNCTNLNQSPNYTIFGKVISGLDVVHTIAAVPVEINKQTGEKSKPATEIKIIKVTISEK